MGADADLQRLDLLVGRVLEVDEHPGARAPSLRLTLDLGPRGTAEAILTSPPQAAGELLGRQLVCFRDPEAGAVVLAAHSHAHGHVLLVPEREVEDGCNVA